MYCHLIIKGRKRVDGDGAKWYNGDVAVADGRIGAIGMLTEAEADRVIEARGLVLVPGLSTGLIYPPEIARCLLRAPIRIPPPICFQTS